jgi:hypothetical protein
MKKQEVTVRPWRSSSVVAAWKKGEGVDLARFSLFLP